MHLTSSTTSAHLMLCSRARLALSPKWPCFNLAQFSLALRMLSDDAFVSNVLLPLPLATVPLALVVARLPPPVVLDVWRLLFLLVMGCIHSPSSWPRGGGPPQPVKIEAGFVGSVPMREDYRCSDIRTLEPYSQHLLRQQVSIVKSCLSQRASHTHHLSCIMLGFGPRAPDARGMKHQRTSATNDNAGGSDAPRAL